MPRILKDITINEVSSVDRGAGRGVKVMLMKRDDDSETIKTAVDLKKAISEVDRASNPAETKNHLVARATALGLTDLIPDTWKRDSGDIAMTTDELNKLVSDAVTAGITKALEEPAKLLAKQADEIVLLKMTDAHKAYMAGCPADTQKTFKAMSPEDRDAFMSKNPLKKAADAVNHDELTKRDGEISDLRKRADEQEKVIKSFQLKEAQADFKKKAVDAGLAEADGEIMRKAFGGDAEAQVTLNKRYAEVTAALKQQVATGALFGEFGTAKGARGDAYASLEAKADELHKKDTTGKLTKEQAFAKVYEDPANRELVQQHKTEDMRKRLTVVAA